MRASSWFLRALVVPLAALLAGIGGPLAVLHGGDRTRDSGVRHEGPGPGGAERRRALREACA